MAAVHRKPFTKVRGREGGWGLMGTAPMTRRLPSSPTSYRFHHLPIVSQAMDRGPLEEIYLEHSRSFAHFLIFLLLSSLCILDMNSLSDVLFANIFSHSTGCLSSFCCMISWLCRNFYSHVIPCIYFCFC